MSLEKAKKLEDLKILAQKICSERHAVVEPQRPIALKAALKEMADYLESQNFSISYSQTSNRGFNAQYNGIVVAVTSTDDNEQLIGADYEIYLQYGQQKVTVRLMVNRGTDIRGPLPGDVDTQIKDYENRYLPALEALSLDELDGSYQLYTFAKGNSGPKVEKFANGKQVVDKLFEGI